jgi:hypothetical protein
MDRSVRFFYVCKAFSISLGLRKPDRSSHLDEHVLSTLSHPHFSFTNRSLTHKVQMVRSDASLESTGSKWLKKRADEIIEVVKVS